MRRRPAGAKRLVSADRARGHYCKFPLSYLEQNRKAVFHLEEYLLARIPRPQRNQVVRELAALTSSTPGYIPPNICLTPEAVGAVLAITRLPRDAVLLLEVGVPERCIRGKLLEHIHREFEGDSYTMSGVGMLRALKLGRPMSGGGELLGVEPWFTNEDGCQTWRSRVASEFASPGAFSKENSYGLLSDLIDYELFLPGLTTARPRAHSPEWFPVLIVRHSVESLLSMAERSARSKRGAVER